MVLYTRSAAETYKDAASMNFCSTFYKFSVKEACFGGFKCGSFQISAAEKGKRHLFSWKDKTQSELKNDKLRFYSLALFLISDFTADDLFYWFYFYLKN